jgi:hypothetical protein
MARLTPPVRLALLTVGTCFLVAWSPAAAAAETVVFEPTGAEQTFTVPAGVTSVHVVAVGARGGTGAGAPVPGGFGAVAIADLAVTPGQVLFVNVGTNGANGVAGGGGFNGGGDSGTPAGNHGGGGGGASDVRTISRSLGTSVFSRLIVAGGGGGSGGASLAGAGGNAGQAGANSTGGSGGQAGTATAGGAGGSGACDGNPGELGAGGDSEGGSCGLPGPPGVGGGGGGGLHGGGAGGTSSSGAGGGGGSSGFGPGATNTSLLTDNTGLPAISFTFAPSSSPPPGGGGGPTPPPSFGDRTGVGLLLATRRIPAKGPIAVRIVNSNAFAVTGSLAARTTRTISVAQKVRVKLKTKTFKVAAQSRKTVKLALQKVLRRQLRRKRKLSLRLTATIKDPAGNSRTVRRTVRPKLRKSRPR